MARSRVIRGAGLGDKSYPTATSQEERERQLIAMAYDLAEIRMREGTASSQEVVHFLRMGSQRDRLEKEIMGEQKKLVTAKAGAYESSKNVETMIQEAMEMFKVYSGGKEPDGEEEILRVD